MPVHGDFAGLVRGVSGRRGGVGGGVDALEEARSMFFCSLRRVGVGQRSLIACGNAGLWVGM